MSPSGWPPDSPEQVASGRVGDVRLAAEAETLTIGEEHVGASEWIGERLLDGEIEEFELSTQRGLTFLREVGDQVDDQRPQATADLVLAGTERPDLVESEGDQIVPRRGRVDEPRLEIAVGDDADRQVLRGTRTSACPRSGAGSALQSSDR